MLQRYLPFWIANLIDRMWVVLASIIVILIPLSRIVPPLYEFRIRSRVFRWYRQLREIEDAAEQADARPDELLPKLDELEHRVEKDKRAFVDADQLYALRSHIDMVRKRLQGGGAPNAEDFSADRRNAYAGQPVANRFYSCAIDSKSLRPIRDAERT